MATNLLIMGTSIDGPSYDIFKPSSLRQLKEIFGWNYVQTESVPPTSTSITLDFETLNVPLNIVGTRKSYLYAPAVSGLNMQFGSLGGSANSTVQLYYTPYLGKKDLLHAAINHYEVTGEFPYVCRIGGSPATLTVSGWLFESKYSGAKYNNVTMSYNGTTFSISGLAEYTTQSVTGALEDIRIELDNRFYAGLSPVRIAKYATTLGHFTQNLSGGSDGSLSDAEFSECLIQVGIPTAVSHISVLTELTSGMTASIQSFFDDDAQPRVWVVPVPEYTPTASSWIATLASSLPGRHNLITGILGDVETTISEHVVNRFGAEQVAIGLVSENSLNLTNMPLAASDFTPLLSKEDMDALYSAGITCVTNHIYNDISTYKGVTMGKQMTFQYVNKSAEIAAKVFSYCDQFIGEPMAQGESSSIAAGVKSVISDIAYFTVTGVKANVYRDCLFVSIVGNIPNEILTINFSIKNRANPSI